MPADVTPTRLAFTIDEVAAFLGCSRTHLLTMRDLGEIQFVKIGPGAKSHIRIPAPEVARLVGWELEAFMVAVGQTIGDGNGAGDGDEA